MWRMSHRATPHPWHQDNGILSDLTYTPAEARKVANIFGWCSDQNCGADVTGGEPHTAECNIANPLVRCDCCGKEIRHREAHGVGGSTFCGHACEKRGFDAICARIEARHHAKVQAMNGGDGE